MPILTVQLLRNAWAQVTLALVLGVALTFIQPGKWYSFLHELGIGLLVAAFVTAFWHLREFSEFFERFAAHVLMSDAYLSKLNVESLTALRSKAARKILEFCSNNPRYERGALGDWIDELMFTQLMPGKSPQSGMYRERTTRRLSRSNISHWRMPLPRCADLLMEYLRRS